MEEQVAEVQEMGEGQRDERAALRRGGGRSGRRQGGAERGGKRGGNSRGGRGGKKGKEAVAREEAK